METQKKEMDKRTTAILQLIGFVHADDPTRIKEDLLRQAGERADGTAVALVRKLDVSKLNESLIEAVKTLFTEAELDEAIKLAENPVVKKARIATASINKAVSDIIGSEASRLMSESSSVLSRQSTPKEGEKPSGLKPDDKVRIGKHDDVDDEDNNWCQRMDKYIGKLATIKKILGFDPEGYEVARIDLDDGEYSWRTRNMTKVSGDVSKAEFN